MNPPSSFSVHIRNLHVVLLQTLENILRQQTLQMLLLFNTPHLRSGAGPNMCGKSKSTVLNHLNFFRSPLDTKQ